MTASVQSTRWRLWIVHTLLGWVNLAISAPVIFLYVGLPLILRQQGWSGTEIGLLQLAGLPALMKFLLAATLERYRWGAFSYRNWALALTAAYAALLLVFAAHDPALSSGWMIFALALALNFFAAWVDIPVNALAIRLLPAGERGRAGAIRSAATSLAAIAGGGVMLVLHARFGWAVPALVLASGLASCWLALITIPQFAYMTRDVRVDAAPAGRASSSEWRGYFAQAGMRNWIGLLLLYVPFIGAAWVYLKPILLDHGLSAGQIAMTVGIAGGAVSALASFMIHMVVRRIGTLAAQPLVALLGVAALLALALGVAIDAPAPGMIAAAMGIAVALGAASGLIFGQMMHMVRPSLAALDYGIQTNIFVVARTCVPLFAGVAFDWFGATGMLLILAIGTFAALLVSLRATGAIAPSNSSLST
jgi:PAT family beta-lactamase induction signal transducer AmpG